MRSLLVLAAIVMAVALWLIVRGFCDPLKAKPGSPAREAMER